MARGSSGPAPEALPEADRLDPFPHPRATSKLYGHMAARSEFDRALTTGRCHHAWLLAGPEGIGKATFAYAVTCFALAEDHERTGEGALAVQADGRTSRQVRALSHPGVMIIRRPYDLKDKRIRAVVTVDEVRRLKGFLTRTAAGGWRVVIVDAIDDLNTAAANALLKSLEEPPPRSLFLLVCREPGRLLPTIRSRCRTIQMDRLSADDVVDAAIAARASADPGVEVPDDVDWRRVAAASGGSVRRCLMLANGNGEAIVGSVRRILTMLPKVDWSEAHALAERLAAANQGAQFEMFYTLLLEDMADVARAGAGMTGLPQHTEGLGAQLVRAGRLASWAELWESIAAERAAAVTLNLDRKTLILDTIDRLANATRG
ncbi:MAG: DNA polymerase III subunit delta' [Pseudomonadota bacterium]